MQAAPVPGDKPAGLCIQAMLALTFNNGSRMHGPPMCRIELQHQHGGGVQVVRAHGIAVTA